MGDVRLMDISEAAYIAGIVDGEGTITLTRTHRGENRRPIVSIANTERQLLEYVQSVIGAGRITSKCIARRHHSPSFTYAVSSRSALTLLEQITPFLRTYKRERAQLLLREYLQVTPRNGKYTADQEWARQEFEARFFRISVRAQNVPR